MKRVGDELVIDVEALLAEKREIPPVPADARKRMLARARNVLAATTVGLPFEKRPVWRKRWLVVAGAVLIAGAAGGVAAYDVFGPAQIAPRTTKVTRSTPAWMFDRGTSASPAPPAVQISLTSASSGEAGHGPLEELRLLERVRSAIGRDDYAGALHLIVEHARRFKNGQLTEECEVPAGESALATWASRGGSARGRRVRVALSIEPAGVDRLTDGAFIMIVTAGRRQPSGLRSQHLLAEHVPVEMGGDAIGAIVRSPR